MKSNIKEILPYNIRTFSARDVIAWCFSPFFLKAIFIYYTFCAINPIFISFSLANSQDICSFCFGFTKTFNKYLIIVWKNSYAPSFF